MKSGMMIGVLVITVLLTNFVLAADVAYVVEDLKKVDKVYMKALNNNGLDVDVVVDEMIKSTDFGDYSIVFVGEGNLMNAKHIPDMPMILVNSKHAEHFGFLKSGGRTKNLGANANLMVEVSGDEMEVYDSSSVKLGGPALTYNYLPKKFINSGVMNYASTVSDEKNKMGSVIAFNEDMSSCFFGISETKFWSSEAWDLFSDCVKFVSGMHDVKINEDTENSVNGVRIKDVMANVYLLQQTAELKCGMEYKIDFVSENVGDFVEEVKFFSKLGVVNWSATKTGLNPGSTTTTGSKTINITDDKFDNQIYTLEVTANIDNDSNILDNKRTRQVMVSGC